MPTSKNNLSQRRRDAKQTRLSISCFQIRDDVKGSGRARNWRPVPSLDRQAVNWSRKTRVNRSRDEHTTECRRCCPPARHLGSGVHRPHVPQRVRARAAAGGRGGHLPPFSSRPSVRFQRFDGSHLQAFISRVDQFAKQANVPVVHFEKGQRKDDVAAAYRKKFTAEEGVLFIGKAQEKTPVFRTERLRNEQTGATYPWLIRSTAMVNHFYIYCVDRDFGPFFLKFCTYFPYNAKLCLNGHEYVKQQLTNRGIRYESLDNGILSCADPKRVQALCDNLSAEKIDALLRKWFRKLPHPFTAKDRQAGYRYQISIPQAEFSLTQGLDRPVTGRVFFEEVIRENLDIGRPNLVQVIFDRRICRRTPGSFRTRVITDGVVPSLHVDYKNSRIKQYHKEGRALRTETTI